VEAGAVTGRAPSIVQLTVPKQAGGDGFAALGAEPSDMYVVGVTPNSAAYKAGIRAGDKLTGFQGEPLRSFNVLMGELSKQKEQPFQLSWRSAQDGQEHTETLTQAMLTTKDGFGQESSSLVLGVSPWMPSSAELLSLDMVTVNLGIGEALRESVTIVPRIVGQMVKVIGGLFSGTVSPKTLGGPVMMYQLASKSAEQGWDSYLHLMAVISINLGVMNLLPIPILDGFGLLAALWEGIRRRPIPIRVREVANVVGLILIVALMGMAFINDITR
ncbi:M50 family metallopeptidase, partial [Archangium sp.]|uniref:M50 family metallopeptidase n=1 Tax=Archangium sp. TaxID=1872627 RepID=UPI002ED8FB1B